MSWMTFTHGGRTYRFAVARTGQGVWIGWPGRAKLFGPAESEGVPEEAETGDVRAPMTGKVVKVEVSAGDRVGADQVLLVLEAMKMEYAMRTHEDGVVTEVLVAQGDQVEAGTLLLVVEPAAEAQPAP